MPLWMRNLLMLGVFAAWIAYMTITFVNGQYPPLPAWSIPGATYALLSGRVIRVGGGEVSVDKDESETKK